MTWYYYTFKGMLKRKTLHQGTPRPRRLAVRTSGFHPEDRGLDSRRGHQKGKRMVIGRSAGRAPPPQTALQRHNSNSQRAAAKKNEEKRKNFKELFIKL